MEYKYLLIVRHCKKWGFSHFPRGQHHKIDCYFRYISGIFKTQKITMKTKSNFFSKSKLLLTFLCCFMLLSWINNTEEAAAPLPKPVGDCPMNFAGEDSIILTHH